MARGSGAGGRRLRQGVRTARGRRAGSTRWLQRQLNDPYVHEAQRRGYRSRAAFKLLELDARLKLLRPGLRVVDLGAAPGGWTEVAVERVQPAATGGAVVAVDRRAMPPVAGAGVLCCDIADPDLRARLDAALGGPAHVLLSDMAADAVGHAATDHLRTLALAESALDLACTLLAPGGAVVLKVLQGAGEPALFGELRRRFAGARRIKPPASRSDSAELYLAGLGLREDSGTA